jgi:hypothetical protein
MGGLRAHAIQLAMGDPMSDNLQVVEGLNISYHDKPKFVGHGLTECHWGFEPINAPLAALSFSPEPSTLRNNPHCDLTGKSRLSL